MRTLMSSLAASIVLAFGMAGAPPLALAQAQPHTSPQTLVREHHEIEDTLARLSREHGRVGAAAKHALAVIAPHERHEEEIVLPLLGLVDSIVDHGVSPDMAWAVQMSDRLRTDRAKLSDEHTQVVAALDELAAAGRRQHSQVVVTFSESVAAHAVNDNEVIIPTALLVGIHVREKLGIKE